MMFGETVLFKMPKAEYRTGMIVDEVDVDGVSMPVVQDHIDSSYPVHPDNIEDTGNGKWGEDDE